MIQKMNTRKVISDPTQINNLLQNSDTDRSYYYIGINRRARFNKRYREVMHPVVLVPKKSRFTSSDDYWLQNVNAGVRGGYVKTKNIVVLPVSYPSPEYTELCKEMLGFRAGRLSPEEYKQVTKVASDIFKFN